MTNKKQSLLDAIIDLGIECCNMDNQDAPLTRDIILGKDKHENVQMARTIIVNQIHLLGYTHSTIAIKFGRTKQASAKCSTTRTLRSMLPPHATASPHAN